MEKALTTHTDTQPRADGTEDILAGTNLNLAEARPYSPTLKLPRAINFEQILNNKRNFGEVEKKTGNFHPSRLAERHATPNDRPTDTTDNNNKANEGLSTHRNAFSVVFRVVRG